jgi:hypothetical protein
MFIINLTRIEGNPNILFFFFIITAIVHLWVVIEILKFPIRFHRNKRKWTNMVLFFHY